ncbi:MAG: hypothetical protein ACOH2O_04200 [Pseudomonas sp.]|jgi:hypothetical protein
MRYLSIPEEHWATVTSAVEESAQLKKYAARLTARLKALFDDDHSRQTLGVTFEILGDGTAWHIESPFGVARAHFRVFTRETGLYGKYVIQKLNNDPEDEPFWHQVWALRITLQGLVHPGDEGGELISLRASLSNRSDDAILHLGLSLLYSLGQE